MSHPFRFGVINEQMLPPSDWIAHVRQVEANGYATLLLRDHVVPDFFGDQYAPLVSLMAAANATSTLRVGTMVLDNDYRHPVMLAKEAATLDALSGGRFELGLGAGWLRTEYEQSGLSFDSAGVRISRLEESIQILKGLWRAEPFTFHGEHYQVTAINGVPKPLQRPGPTILLGGGHKRMLTLAGSAADSVGILTSSVASGTMIADPAECTPAAVTQKLEWIRQGAGDRYPQIELSLIPTFIFTDQRRSATEQWLARKGWSSTSIEEAWVMPAVFIGTVEQIVEEIVARRAQYGFSYYVVSDKQMTEFAPVVERLAGK